MTIQTVNIHPLPEGLVRLKEGEVLEEGTQLICIRPTSTSMLTLGDIFDVRVAATARMRGTIRVWSRRIGETQGWYGDRFARLPDTPVLDEPI